MPQRCGSHGCSQALETVFSEKSPGESNVEGPALAVISWCNPGNWGNVGASGTGRGGVRTPLQGTEHHFLIT